ncbi:MAG: mannose-1-phosphate guanylyltransferase [Gemmatimonadota bacterium]
MDIPPTIAVVLAGGIGSRFWPASRPARPKQLLALAGDAPLIVDTVRRAERLVGAENVRLLTGSALVDPFRSVLPEYPEERFWVEPVARSTGPALTWAAARVAAIHPEATMISLHADHLIRPFDAFESAIIRAARASYERHGLVCLGIRPTRPETGYGYIEPGDETAAGVRAVRRFVEKPDVDTARGYVAGGRHLWNSGIFVWRAGDFLDAVRRLTPEIARALPALDEGGAGVEAFFDQVEPVSVDVGVLERAGDVEVVVAEFEWDDVGTWTALARSRPADADGNVTSGDAALVEAHDNIVWSEDGRVVLFGVDDLVVVHSGGETLVTRRDLAPQLKRALTRLNPDEMEAT